MLNVPTTIMRNISTLNVAIAGRGKSFGSDPWQIGIVPRSLLILLACIFAMSAGNAWAEFEDFDDEEPVTVYLKKIRDGNGVYLRDVTKNLAKNLSQSGEYSVKRYNPKNYEAGPVVTVAAPTYDVEEQKKGSATRKLTNVGISMASSLGGLFGKDQEAQELDNIQTELNQEEGLLNMIPDNVAIVVQVRSTVSLVDSDNDIEISVPVFAEHVFKNKQQYLDDRDALFSQNLFKSVMATLADSESGDEF